MESKGYQIVTTRYRSPHGEIDIIAITSTTLVFVEVKARRTQKALTFALTPQQYKRTYQTAEYFLSTHDDINLLETRFDAIMVDQGGVCEHVEGIWETDLASHT